MNRPSLDRLMLAAHVLQQNGLADVSVWIAAESAAAIREARPRRKRMTQVRIAGATGGMSKGWIEEGRLAEAKG